VKIPDRIGFPQRDVARRRFDRAAERFDAASGVHREAGARLLDRLPLFSLKAAHILDLGTATGAVAAELAGRYPGASIVALDSSLPMLEAARARMAGALEVACLAGDAHALPLAAGSMDLVVANLLLPWCVPEQVFAELNRVLRRGGLVLFTTVGPDSLVELRRAWATIDEDIHVHGFVDMHDLGDLALRAGLEEPVMDVDRLELRYTSFDRLLTDLRATGSANAAAGRRRTLTGRGRARAFREALVPRDRSSAFSVTVELIFGQAWGGGIEAARPQAGGAVRIPLDSIARRPPG
jgi:malonyl-CoA O-methyltransferase